MKAFVFTAAMLASTAAWAQGPTTATSDNAPDPEQVICRSEANSTSRISRTRVCRTRAEWNAVRAENRRNVDRARSNEN